MQKETKIFNVDGTNMQFNSEAFNMFFKDYKKREEIKIQELESNLGEDLGVTRDAVHNWRFGQTGPSDIETINKISDYFGLSDYKVLLKERKEDVVMQITERQKNSLKKIYDAIIDFLIEFQKTDGFNNYWYDFAKVCKSEEHVENNLYYVAEEAQNKVINVFQKEYIIIHKLEIYPQLEEYVYDDLCDIYNGKLSYAYRFEAGVENVDGTRDTVTTSEDYTAALTKINDLLDPYMS